ncbi:MAG: hypothetical protein KAU62_09180 [Candidatus Heimdallarchaeota archaeon]|nr:hypothetical protein [Candidatus Heimdallarchaeota archaeon]MCK4611312.1 hypothetical protein [Candidatus Heimdallarchaeota archaeon]
MIEKLRQFLKSRIFLNLFAFLTSIWVYAPVLVGILFWMAAWMVPAAYVFWRFFYIFGPISWFNKGLLLKFIEKSLSVRILLVFELLVITIGLVLFVWGLVHVVIAKYNKRGLITDGPYNYIRHPQHLGLILISFAFSLYIPGTEDMGIRAGEIVSWFLFVLIQFLWTDYEEKILAKKFGDEFIEYRRMTGSFFPRIFSRKKEKKSFYEIKYWNRYFITLLVFLGFFLILYLLVYFLNLPFVY